MNWYLTGLPAASALTALVELDQVHVGQWMISRPIVLGPLLGWAVGAPGLGAAAGALVELFCVDVLPVGSAIPINGAVAVAAFVLLSAGPSGVAPAAAFPAALAAGGLFRRVESLVRARRGALSRAAGTALEEGREVPFGRLLSAGLGLQAAATAMFVYGTAAALGPALAWGWDAAPAAGRRGLQMAFDAAPWVGLSALLYALRPK